MRPIFTMSVELLRLRRERVAQLRAPLGSSRCTISSAAAMCIAVGKVSFDDCDMLTSSFGWTGFFEPSVAAGELDRAVRDHLVDVHVGLRAAAGLPDAQREVVVELAGDDLVGGLRRCRSAFSAASLPEVAVDERGGLLEDGHAADDRARHAVGADREVVQRALRSARPSSGRRGTSIGPMLSVSVRVDVRRSLTNRTYRPGPDSPERCALRT